MPCKHDSGKILRLSHSCFWAMCNVSLCCKSNLLRREGRFSFVCITCSRTPEVKMVASLFALACCCFLWGSWVNDSSTSFTSVCSFPKRICWREMDVKKYCLIETCCCVFLKASFSCNSRDNEKDAVLEILVTLQADLNSVDDFYLWTLFVLLILLHEQKGAKRVTVGGLLSKRKWN